MSFTAIIDAKIDQFESALSKAQARMEAFAQRIGERVAAVGKQMQNFGSTLSIGITAPLIALGAAAIKTFGDLQSLKMGLEAVMGSAEAASDEFEKLKEVAKLPGLGLKEAAQGSVSLQSAGFSADEARRSLMAFGNALATVGKGANELQLVNLALTQLQNKSSGFGQDLRQLTEQLPQLRGAMTAAFGTADSEAIAKLGYTGSQVVQMLTAEFEKLPKVTGGIKNAFENLRDSTTISLAQIGEAINKNFDIEGKLSKLSDFISGITDRFSKLDPTTQKVVLVMVGLAAAIGPLLVAIGSLLQLAPLIGTAFAAITGPIGIAIGLIAAAAYVIYKNWDAISAYFTTGAGSELWTSITSAAKQLWSQLTTIFNAIKAFLIDVWDKIGVNVMNVVRNTFNIVLSIVDGVMGYLSGLIDTFAALLRGDFSGALEGVGKMFNSIFTMMLKVGAGVLSNLSNYLAGFFKMIGADGIGKALTDFATKIAPVREETKGLSTEVEKVTESVGKKTTALKTVVPALQGAKKATTDYKAELISLFSNWGYYEYQVKALSAQFSGIRDTARKAGASIKELATIAREELGSKLALALNQFDLKEVGSGLSGLSGQITIPTVIKADADFSALNEKLRAVKSTMQGLVLDLGNAVATGISDMAASIGEALASGENVFSAIGNSLIKGLGSLAKSIGEQMIAFGIAGIALKKLMMNPYLAVAAGVALVALGSVASASVGKQASSYSGGYASSSMNSTTQSADYSQFRGALYNDDKQVVELKLRNGDLQGAIKIGATRNNRLG